MPKKLFWLLIFFGSLKILIHFLANSNYGLHADELYYIALSKHLQWGFLDNGPFIAVITKISSLFFGESTFSYRITPTFFSGAAVCITGYIAYRLGGKTTAITIACLAVIFSPAYLATSYFLQPIVFEQFFWTLAALLFLIFMQTKNQYCLYGFATTAGIGFLNKYTILLLLFAFFIGLVVTKNLYRLKWKVVSICILVFVVIISPNLIWQLKHGFPIFNYLGVVKSNTKFLGFGEYIFQFTFFHAAGIAVWLAGFLFLVLSKSHRKYALFSIAFLVVLIALLIIKGKIYYGLGAFPFLFAAGGVCWETMLKKVARLWKVVFYSVLIVPSIIALPIVVPILPFNLTIKYLALMTTYTNIYQPLIWEDGRVHSLPQTYADMLGWEQLSNKVDKMYQHIPIAERNDVLILTDKYFITGALYHYLKAGKEKIIAPNNSFALWSPKKLNARKIILVKKSADNIVGRYAEKITAIDSVDYPNSRINGTHIYLLNRPSAILKNLYKEELENFYKRVY